MKKRIAPLLVTALAAAVLSACSSNSDNNAGSNAGSNSSPPASGASAPAMEYNGNDISKHVDLTMYVVGDKPADADEVIAEINKLTEADLNASLKMNYIPLSDYEQKYSLLLVGGEKIDLIYTSTWSFYNQEATKGAFAEVTDDVLAKYMPMTNEKQSKMSFEQAKIGGKAYFVPKNSPYVNNAVPVMIRGDLREKYGIPEVNSLETLEQYFDAVAANEKGVYPYAASQNNVEVAMNLFQSGNSLLPVSGLDKLYGYFYQEGAKPTVDDMVMQYGTEQYKAFVTKMKGWADKGYWTKNAVMNSISPRDAFENGTSASLFWNIDTIEASQISVNASHPEWKPEVVDIWPNVVRASGMYIGDGVAVVAQSENQERAFMLLDKLKFDERYYDLERYGIEGKHWVSTGDNTWMPGDAQANFSVGNATSWGIKNDLYERIQGEAGAKVSDVRNSLFAKAITEVSSGFVFDDSKVKTELSLINEVCSQYVPLLELGQVKDVDATLAEFNDKLKQAGLDKLDAEFRTQFSAYLAGLDG